MKKIVLVILSSVILSSCFSTLMTQALTKLGVYDDHVQISAYEFEDRKILLIPMHHVGTKKFYDDVKFKIDSLSKIDYSFYYEGIKIDRTTRDSTKIDTDLRKLRKLIGVVPSAESYLNKIKVLAEKKNYTFKKELKGQPSNKKLGLLSAGIDSENVDMKLSELIDNYEENNKEIKLKECDRTTGLKEEYKCQDVKFDNEAFEDVFISMRNKLIINKLKKNEVQNLAIVYGKKHFQEIIEFLNETNYQKITAASEN